MRKKYDSTRLNLLDSMQRRVGLVLTGTKKIYDHCLFMILFMLGMTWLPAKAITSADGTAYNKAGAVRKVKAPTAMTSIQWKTATYSGSGSNGQLAAGDVITYRIYIRNTGDQPLTNVTVTDTIPANTTLQTASVGNSGGTGPIKGSAEDLVWTIPSIPVGGSDVYVQLIVTVNSTLTGVSYINNAGYVDIGDGTGKKRTAAPATSNLITSGPGTNTAWPSIRIPVDNGMNTLHWKSASYKATGPNGTITSGDVITYTIHVRNNGSLPLTNVVINDIIPTYTTFVDADGAVTPDSDNRLSWTIASMPVGGYIVRSFRVRVAVDLTGASSIDNIATVDNGNGKGFTNTYPSMAGDSSKPNTISNSGPSVSLPVSTTTSFVAWKLVVNESGETTVSPGGILTYYIYVKNTGSIAIPLVTVNDPLPDGTEYEEVMDGGAYFEGGGADVQPTFNFNINNLAAGATATVRFRVKVDDRLPEELQYISNTASVSTADTSKVPTFNCDPSDPNCQRGTSTRIKITPGPDKMFVSNVMTPNNDGKNDYFIVQGIDKFPGSTLYIFNRWGGTVYVSKNYVNTWRAEGLSEGTYYYRLELKQPAGGVEVLKGWVMVIR